MSRLPRVDSFGILGTSWSYMRQVSCRMCPTSFDGREPRSARRAAGESKSFNSIFIGVPFLNSLASVVLVPAHALDVVPSGRLVAQITLIDSGVVLPGYLHRHHLEMPHVVARRRLVALGTVPRA